jgi:hypothetical protein
MNVDDVIKAAMQPAQTDKDVHTEHCCARHGCQYMDPHCTVRGGLKKDRKPQSFMCEVCDDELRDGGLELAYLLNEMYDKGFSAASVDINHLYRCGCDTPGGSGCLGA